MIEGLMNLVRREVERGIARFSTWSIGTVSSYDPATHTAKVQLQPEDTQTGWLPINSMAVGNDFGISIGPSTGLSCLVHFQDGDREAGVILGFFFTDKEKPVSVEEGEIVVKAKFGQSIVMKKDGSILMTDKSGATFGLDGSGNIAATGKSGAKIEFDAGGNIILTPAGSGQVLLGGAGAVLKAARDTDPTTPGNIVHATSTKVKVL